MTRLGWVGLLLLGACTQGPLEAGRYSCDIDGGVEQCPDDWRCGFEGHCRRPGDVSKAWRCEADHHCENGYRCGLNDLGDAGECHEPAGKNPHACFDDTHCTAGWHCGPSGRCYDRTVTTDHVCRFDAGDCADGWRCGLNGRCQNQDAGAPYACLGDAGLEDGWCELGWRCAPEGRCINPVADALGAARLPVGPSTKIHPLATVGSLERFAASQVYEAGLGFGRQTVAFVQDGQLRARVIDKRSSASYASYSLGPWDGGTALAVLGNRGESLGDPRVLNDVARLYVAQTDGGVNLFTLGPNGTAVQEDVFTAFPASRMTLGTAHGTLSPRVLTFNDVPEYFHRLAGGRYEVFDSFLRQEKDRLYFSEAFANNKLIDLVSVRNAPAMECIFAVDRRGLWVAQRTYHGPNDPPPTPGFYDFEEVELPLFTNDSCRTPAPTNQRITRLAPLGREWLGLSSTGLDGGASVSIIDLRPLWARPFSEFVCTTVNGEQCTQADRIPIEPYMGPCRVCAGGQLLDFATVLDSAKEPIIEVRCGGSDGGTNGFFTLTRRNSTGDCLGLISEGESGIFSRTALLNPDHMIPGQVALASPEGFIWTGSSSQNVTSELLDRVATSVSRRGPLPSELMAFTSNVTVAFVPGVGFSASPESGVVTAVSNFPEWVVTKDRVVLDLTGAASSAEARQLAVIGNLVNSFNPPHLGTTAKSAAATVLVVSAGSSVFSAEMNATLSGQQPYASLSLRVVSPSQIDSIAFPSKATAGVYLRGYAVTPNGVLRLTAQTSARWSFEEVPLPASLVPQEVWFEEDRGRVGFADGTVYSLPSRVAIAPPLDDGVVDYAQACGQQLALGSSGLFRLEQKAGSSVGQWKELPLVPGFASTGIFAKGRIHAVGSNVYVFKRSGEAAQLTFENCPSP